MPNPNPFILAELWMRVMKDVKPFGLESEVIQFAFQDLGITEGQLREALWHARCEWDV